MTCTKLKIIALIFMTIDHIGVCIPNMPIYFRWIGRIASPLFFFCVAESVVHTSNKRLYLKRLWKSSIIMVMIESAVPPLFEMYFKLKIDNFNNNIFLTIFQGALIAIILEDTKTDRFKRKKYLLGYTCYQCGLLLLYYISENFNPFSYIGLNTNLIPILNDWDRILFTVLGSTWHIEGSVIIMLQIVIFYFCRENKKQLSVCYSVYCGLYFVIFVPQLGIKAVRALQQLGISTKVIDCFSLSLRLMGIPTMPFDAANNFIESLLQVNFQWMMIFALPLILLYDSNKGKGVKWLFYIYYPMHLVLLHIISSLI